MSLPNTPLIGAGSSIGHGTVAGTYVALANVVKIAWPKYTVGKVDTSNFGSVSGTPLIAVKTYIPGWQDPGEWDFEVQYNYSQIAALKALRGVPQFWEITIPDGTVTGTTIQFAGFMTEMDGEIPMDNKLITNKFKVQMSGSETITAGT